MLRKTIVWVILLLGMVLLGFGQQSPDEFFNVKIGADRTLVGYPDIVRYFQYLDRESARIKVTDEGASTLGNPMILAFISSEQNIKNLDDLIQINRKLAQPDTISNQEALDLLERSKVFVLITAAIHASEIAASQMAMPLAHQLAVTDEKKCKRILDDVVILLMPSINPDGNIMVTDWYRKNLDTEYEGCRMPYLYHHYAGHDTNRDFFMLNLKETRVVNAVLHRRYFPHIFLDMHQMGKTGPRMFIPPFKDPLNQNLDPLLLRTTNLIGSFMAFKLQQEGKSGVASAYAFDAYWPGGTKNTAWYKNVVGVLTELASVDTASPVYVEANELRVSSKGLPEYKAQVNFPDPWRGGWWHLKDIIDYEMTAVKALIEVAGQNREYVISNFYKMGIESIKRGESEPPYAYVIPADQWDRPAAFTFLKKMEAHGIKIFRAQKEFVCRNKIYKQGSHVIFMNQPYRRFIKVMMERQHYPEIRQMRGGPILEPYDAAGWTLPLQMGIDYDEINSPIALEEETFSTAQNIDYPPETIGGPADGNTYLIPARCNRSLIVINRLLKAGIPVSRICPTGSSGAIPCGTFLVRTSDVPSAEFKRMLKGTGLDVRRDFLKNQSAAIKIKKPRIGIYQSYVPSIDEGWTRWVLDHFEFSYTVLHNPDFKNKKLSKKFDVIIFADMIRSIIVDGKYGGPRSYYNPNTHPDFKGGIEKTGSQALKDFVKAGGTLILLDSASEIAIQDFSLPLTNKLKRLRGDKFYCPGSILKIEIDPHDPLAWGMPPEGVIFFSNSPAFNTQLPASPHIDRKVVASFAVREPHLLSGYVKGEKWLNRAAVIVRFDYYNGHVIVMGGRVQHRAQTSATFKFFFNAILYPNHV
jgi:hypothetical protein